EDALFEAVAHEASHALGVDAIADLFPDKRLRDAEKRYLKLLRNQSEEAATALQGTPDKLRREATALLIGETLRESP
ncbi:hypothetical protein R0K19_28905, partial [Bacillus sp. SIMBA_161]